MKDVSVAEEKEIEVVGKDEDGSKRSGEGGSSEGGIEKADVEAAATTTGRADSDVAARFLANLDPDIAAQPVTEAEARHVRWKIDLIIMPLLAATVILSATDKVIISNAAIFGMKTDAHLAKNEYSWVGSIFYFGYLVAEYPCAILIQRLPVAKFLSLACAGWAVLLLCSAATHNFGGLATCRFLMGATEAAVYPIASIVTVMWWTNEEQPIRVAFWFNQGSSIVAGLVSYGVGHANVASTSIALWRLLFLVLGGWSVIWAVVIWLFLPDSPPTCWWMSERQKYVCLVRIQKNNTGVEDRKIKWYQVRECLLDPKSWLLCVFTIAQNIPNGGLITFAAIIVSGLGYSKLDTVLLGVPTGVLATVWQLILAIPCAKYKNVRCTVIAAANVVPLICAVLMWRLPRSNKHGLLAAYYMFYTYWAPYVLASSLPMANVSGHSKKVTMNAIFYIGYCLGNILGPQVFRDGDAPQYSQGYVGLLCCVVVATGAIGAYAYLCWAENRRRDATQASTGSGVGSTEADAFNDLTDKEKPGFRYSY